MAPQTTDSFAAPFRIINNRLGTTPTWQLPHVVPHLANIISKCGPIWSSAAASESRDKAESDVLLHRYRTRISTLLQDKNPQARWAAVVLVKATVEAGGLAVVRESGSWIRFMIAMVGSIDPSSTKKLCIVTITRCFLLTQGHQSILRELTTPMLPAFLSATLKILHRPSDVKESLLLIALDALSELLPYHPSSIRPFLSQIRSCILPLLAPTPSSLVDSEDPATVSVVATEAVASGARRLYIMLFYCAPKKTEAEEWVKAAKIVCDTIHITADRVFRAFIEDRQPITSYPKLPPLSTAETVGCLGGSLMGLPGWTGIQGGIERLVGLLRTLKAFMATHTSFAVAAPVGSVLEVFTRVVSVLSFPNQSKSQFNPEIGRDEREGVFEGLPDVHTAAVDALGSMNWRLGHGAASLFNETLEQCLLLLRLERSSIPLRIAIYGFVSNALHRFGLTVEQHLRDQLSACVSIGCEDLLSSLIPMQESTEITLDTHETMTKDSTFRSSKIRQPLTDVQRAAANMLSSALTDLPDNFLSRSTRSQIDRIAILVQHEEILLASVLYPGKGAWPSLMPLLARAGPKSLVTEGLMKPRMPLIQSKHDDQLSFGEMGTQITQEAGFSQVYSGNGFTSAEIIALPERGSLVEDSMRTEKDSNLDTALRTTAHPMSPEIYDSTYSPPKSTGDPTVEVPETQPLSLTGSNKRTREGVNEDSANLQFSDKKDSQPDRTAETTSSTKRLRLTEPTTQSNETTNVIESQKIDQGEVHGTGTSSLTNTHSVLGMSTPKAAIVDEGSDSDESSIPPIDPTPATDDEDEDEDEETEDEEHNES